MTLPKGYENEQELTSTVNVEKYLNAPSSELNELFAAIAIQTFSVKGAFQGLLDRLGSWGRDTEKVRCKNGQEAFRFKNPDNTFHHQLVDWKKKVEGEANAAGLGSIKGSAEIDAKKTELFEILEALRAGFEARIKAAYNPYHLDPCNDEAKRQWAKANAKMLDFDLIKDLIICQLVFARGDTKGMSKALDNARKLLN